MRGFPCNGYTTVYEEAFRDVPGTDLPVLRREVERLPANAAQFFRKFIVAVSSYAGWNLIGTTRISLPHTILKKRCPLHFPDALLAATKNENGISTIYIGDRHFEKVPGLTVINPSGYQPGNHGGGLWAVPYSPCCSNLSGTDLYRRFWRPAKCNIERE